MPLAVTSLELSIFLHITAVVVGFGTTFAESITFPIAMKLDRRHLPYVHRLQRTINSFFALPALVVVVATGLYQVHKLGFSLGDAWLSASFAIVILIALLNVAYFIPEDRRLEAMVSADLAAGDEPSADYMRRSRLTGIAGALTGVLLIVVIFLMVVKPGA